MQAIKGLIPEVVECEEEEKQEKSIDVKRIEKEIRENRQKEIDEALAKVAKKEYLLQQKLKDLKAHRKKLLEEQQEIWFESFGQISYLNIFNYLDIAANKDYLNTTIPPEAE